MTNVAVVTPFCTESSFVIAECFESVNRQTISCHHFRICDNRNVCNRDDFATARDGAASLLYLPGPHGDNGNLARAVGSLLGQRQMAEFVAYLDADNWYYPEHMERMLELAVKSQADVVTATRSIHRLDGSLMYVDEYESEGKSFADTSCLVIFRRAFELLPLWAMMPKELGPICDRVMWHAIKSRGFKTAHCSVPTVAFRTQYEVHYRNVGETPPPGTKSNADSTEKAIHWWCSLDEETRCYWERILFCGVPFRFANQSPLSTRHPESRDGFSANGKGVASSRIQVVGTERNAEAESEVTDEEGECKPSFRNVASGDDYCLAGSSKPDNAEISISAVLNEALGLHKAGQMAEAMAQYDRILEMDPRHADALHLKGLIAHQRGDNRVAVELIERAVKINPWSKDFPNSLGKVCRSLGNYDRALELYRRSLEVAPNASDTHFNMAIAFKRKGDLNDAISFYRRAVQIDPGYTHAWNNLGVALVEAGDFDQAIECYQEAIKRDPKYGQALNNLGAAFKKRGDWTNALATFRDAVAADPRLVEAHNNLAKAYIQLARYDDAIESCAKALAASPIYTDALYNTACAYLFKGEISVAVDHFERALSTAPRNPEVLNGLGAAYAKSGDNTKALSLLRESVKYGKQGESNLRGFKGPSKFNSDISERFESDFEKQLTTWRGRRDGILGGLESSFGLGGSLLVAGWRGDQWTGGTSFENS